MRLVANYSGRVENHGGPFTQISIDAGSGGGTEISVTVKVEIDSAGNEAITYSYPGGKAATYFLDATGQYESGNGVSTTLRPADESAGPSTLGFILPPTCSKTFARAIQADSKLPGDPCSNAEGGCDDLLVPVAFSGTKLQCQWKTSAGTIDFVFVGQPRLRWKLTASSSKFPAKIEYNEFDDKGLVKATGSYALVSTVTKDADLKKEDYVPNGKQMVVMKGHSGFGPFHGGDKDPWGFYAIEQGKWEVKEHPPAKAKSAPWVPIGIISALIIVAIVVKAVMRKKND